MDIRHLEYFLQVIKDKSITSAAKKLFLTQPALSKAIKKLEEDLDVTLFVKTPHGIEPTDCGIQLASSAAEIVNAFNHIQEQLHDLSNLKTGNVNIGLGPMFSFAYLSEILTEFQNIYPNIKVTPYVMSYKKILPMLHNYDLDIVIAHTADLQWKHTTAYDNLSCSLIDSDVMIMICNKNHRLCKKDTVNISDLQDELLNICSSDYALHESILKYFYEAGIKPNIDFVCNSIELLIDITVSSNSVCILPRYYIQKIAKCFPDRELLTFDPPLHMNTYLLMRRGVYNSYSSLAFAEFIARYFDKSLQE